MRFIKVALICLLVFCNKTFIMANEELLCMSVEKEVEGVQEVEEEKVKKTVHYEEELEEENSENSENSENH